MDYCWIESPSNTNLELNLSLLTNLIKCSVRWPKERVHGDEKLTI